MKFTKKDYTFDDLIDIIKILRSDGGCPWDQVQTHQTIKYCLLEEACEAMEALDKKEPDNFADELGDVLLQVVFHSEMAEEEGTFAIQDVLNHICRKLISRHTHIFGNDKSNNSADALELWKKNKKQEKGLKTHSDIMRDVCSYLPSLVRAQKVQEKAAHVGFDWNNITGVIDKLREETNELEAAVKQEGAERIEEEFGDLLFSCVNVSRFLNINAEEALKKATDKFITRFERMEAEALKSGSNLDNMSFEEMDRLWDCVKKSK